MTNVGERLRTARERAGLSLGQVFQYEGIQKGHLSEMERGIKEPTGETVRRLARRYRTSADFLLGLSDNPQPRLDAPLPDAALEILDIIHDMSASRQDELLAHARVLHEAEQRERNERQAAVYLDRAEAMGPDVLEALLTALDILHTSGRPAAEDFVRRFWAEKTQQMAKEDLHKA